MTLEEKVDKYHKESKRHRLQGSSGMMFSFALTMVGVVLAAMTAPGSCWRLAALTTGVFLCVFFIVVGFVLLKVSYTVEV